MAAIMNEATTWDGQPVSPEPPHGATVIVHRRGRDGLEFLLLHRAHHGPDYEGEWAWTPPSGARHPGEDVEACARRELAEETGLELDVHPTAFGTFAWVVFVAEAGAGDDVTLSPEHDRFEWLDPEEAARRCTPGEVAAPLRLFHARLRAVAP
jgi:8-oxo-dGTP pyrophosphatase MutT (NUDIX family)